MRELDAVPEGNVLVAKRPEGGESFSFSAMSATAAKAQYAEVISDEFRGHGWAEWSEKCEEWSVWGGNRPSFDVTH